MIFLLKLIIIPGGPDDIDQGDMDGRHFMSYKELPDGPDDRGDDGKVD